MWIDGRWVGSHSGKEFTRESPAHETLVGRYPLAEEADADAAVAAARRAFAERQIAALITNHPDYFPLFPGEDVGFTNPKPGQTGARVFRRNSVDICPADR
jgi:hypothetical protein